MAPVSATRYPRGAVPVSNAGVRPRSLALVMSCALVAAVATPSGGGADQARSAEEAAGQRPGAPPPAQLGSRPPVTVTPRSKLPIRRGPIVFVAPDVQCPGQPGPPARDGHLQVPLLKYASPEYPPDARQAGVVGVVLVEALIGTKGTVESTNVLRGVDGLNGAATDAVKKWQFAKTCNNGNAFPMIQTIAVRFPPE